MIHKGRGTHFRNLIGDSHNPDERMSGCTPDELAQMSHYQRESVGRENRYVVDNCGVVLGIKDKAVIYSCGGRK